MYLAEHQRISTDPENILIRSIAQKVSKSASKGKEKAKAADKGKRVADDNGNSSAPKRPRDEAGPSGMPFACTAGIPLMACCNTEWCLSPVVSCHGSDIDSSIVFGAVRWL